MLVIKQRRRSRPSRRWVSGHRSLIGIRNSCPAAVPLRTPPTGLKLRSTSRVTRESAGMNRIWHGILDAFGAAGSMTWQVTWSLILGFTLSAIVQALVRKSTIARLLTDDNPKSLAAATGLGAASSS